MRYCTVVLCLLLGGCTVKYGEFESKVLRMETQQNHASMERIKGTGSRLQTVSSTGFPEWWLGAIDHTQIFLPKLKCISFYREDGTMERTECEEITPVDVENDLRAPDGVVGDRITTGTACELESSFKAGLDSVPIWTEAMKQAVANSELDKDMKTHWLDTLSRLAEMLGGAK